MRLDEAQIERWNDDGFLVVPQLIDEVALARLRQAYDEVIERDVNAAGDRMLGGITRQVMSPSTAHPAFRDNPARQAASVIAEQLLGTPAVMNFDMLIYKPAGHAHDPAWHQDRAYSGNPSLAAGQHVPLTSIQFRVPLDDVDEENGCMHFVPGRHREGSLKHPVASGEPDDPGRLLALIDPDTQLDLNTQVVAPLSGGGATLHSFATPHYTGPNRSTNRGRRAYIFNLGGGGPRLSQAGSTHSAWALRRTGQQPMDSRTK